MSLKIQRRHKNNENTQLSLSKEERGANNGRQNNWDGEANFIISDTYNVPYTFWCIQTIPLKTFKQKIYIINLHWLKFKKTKNR